LKRLTDHNLRFEIKKLVLKPGDRVVFTADQLLNVAQIKELRERLDEQLPDGVHAIIITGSTLEKES